FWPAVTRHRIRHDPSQVQVTATNIHHGGPRPPDCRWHRAGLDPPSCPTRFVAARAKPKSQGRRLKYDADDPREYGKIESCVGDVLEHGNSLCRAVRSCRAV